MQHELREPIVSIIIPYYNHGEFIDATIQSIERIPDKILLLMGESKAGKTTLLYYLLKKKLILEIN